jgi:hypothetical protein
MAFANSASVNPMDCHFMSGVQIRQGPTARRPASFRESPTSRVGAAIRRRSNISSQQSPKDEVLIRVRAQKAGHVSGGNGERNRRSIAAFDS